MEVNNAIRINNGIIQTKIDNPYNPCNNKIQDVSSVLRDFYDALEELEINRKKYNEKITHSAYFAYYRW